MSASELVWPSPKSEINASGRTRVAIFERDPRWFSIIRDLLPETKYDIVFATSFYNPTIKVANGTSLIQHVIDAYGIDVALVGHKLPHSPTADTSDLENWPSTQEIAIELRKAAVFTIGFFGETADSPDKPEVDMQLFKTDRLLFRNLIAAVSDRVSPSKVEITASIDPRQVTRNSKESHAYHDFNNVVGMARMCVDLLTTKPSERLMILLNEIFSNRFPSFTAWLSKQSDLLGCGYQPLIDKLVQIQGIFSQGNIDLNEITSQLASLSAEAAQCRAQFNESYGLFPDKAL